MIAMRVGEIAAALRTTSAAGLADCLVGRVSTDSRRIEEGDLFIALRGENFDGHGFVADALAGGATACLCERSAGERIDAVDHAYCLWVDDTYEALTRLACYYRREVMSAATKVIAVTGSNGKTTTKQLIHQVLGGSLRGKAAVSSFNNHIGVPLTLLAADCDDDYLVVEVGTSSPGEIGPLAALVSPELAVITSVGEAHLEGLGNADGIAVEKCSLLDGLRTGETAIVNVDHPAVRALLAARERDGAAMEFVRLRSRSGDDDAARADRDEAASQACVMVECHGVTLDGTRFSCGGRAACDVPLPGVHHAMNASLALCVAMQLGIAFDEAAGRLASFRAVSGRASVHREDGITIIDDSYNANPTSMSAALGMLAVQPHDGRRVVVCGDMKELGDHEHDLHLRVLCEAMDAGIDLLVGVGPAMVRAGEALSANGTGRADLWYRHAEEAASALPRALRAHDCVLVKGSRAMRLERVVEAIRAWSRASSRLQGVRG